MYTIHYRVHGIVLSHTCLKLDYLTPWNANLQDIKPHDDNDDNETNKVISKQKRKRDVVIVIIASTTIVVNVFTASKFNGPGKKKHCCVNRRCTQSKLSTCNNDVL